MKFLWDRILRGQGGRKGGGQRGIKKRREEKRGEGKGRKGKEREKKGIVRVKFHGTLVNLTRHAVRKETQIRSAPVNGAMIGFAGSSYFLPLAGSSICNAKLCDGGGGYREEFDGMTTPKPDSTSGGKKGKKKKEEEREKENWKLRCYVGPNSNLSKSLIELLFWCRFELRNYKFFGMNFFFSSSSSSLSPVTHIYDFVLRTSFIFIINVAEVDIYWYYKFVT